MLGIDKYSCYIWLYGVFFLIIYILAEMICAYELKILALQVRRRIFRGDSLSFFNIFLNFLLGRVIINYVASMSVFSPIKPPAFEGPLKDCHTVYYS